ncbi:hypothetical protein RFI_15916 [Reticulomyxa filosa]|uniref:Uncharacterized protein n=1 Tax=Reticulomyxa filosa TaxID=46433 RepID=X6N4S7_RETFI|nr:hypothetical protein RFI_15916 [Reticulomyxa filosa]|eukprot:ETO21290.1 hypothetical protein RFI_15916 [Reticulomyxa filosa]
MNCIITNILYLNYHQLQYYLPQTVNIRYKLHSIEHLDQLTKSNIIASVLIVIYFVFFQTGSRIQQSKCFLFFTKQKTQTRLVLVLGESVGKTALIHKCVHDEFIQEYRATVGADFKTKEISIDDKTVTLQVTKKKVYIFENNFCVAQDGCVLVYDITNKKSFDKIKTLHSTLLKYAEFESKLPFNYVEIRLICNQIG